MGYMRAKSGRRLDSYDPSPARGKRLVLLGDSRTADCHYESDPHNVYSTNMDWFGWGNYARPGGPVFDVVNNAGVGGETTAQILARVQADVLDYEPDYCTLWAGINNGLTSYAAADAAFDDMSQIISLLLAQGIYVFLISETVTSSSANNLPRYIHYYNNKLRALAAASPCVEWWDFNELIQDPSSANGIAKSSMLRDGTHLNPYAASLIGRTVVAPALAKFPGQLVSLKQTSVDQYGVSAGSPDILTNGLMTGSGGTPGSGHTGTLPDGWTSGGNAAAVSVQSRADGFGNDIKVILSATSTSGCYVSRTIQTSSVAAGKSYIIEGDLNIDSVAGVSGVDLTVQVTIGGVPWTFGVGRSTQSPASSDSIATGRYVLRSRPFTVPAGTVGGATLNFRVQPGSASATATVRLGRVSVRAV